MTTSTLKYDEPSDTLYISFAPGEKATGIELNENLLLRVNKAERRAVGLTIFNYSILAQPTEAGLRSLPLTGLSGLSEEVRELALEILLRSPLKEVLAVSVYTPSMTERIPIASVTVDTREAA
ncbi:MAG: DUF2283 domain-containing protein [Caldilineaceae bacterium]|nr:DUF2283 domain-containing protein [Caldilineaceae bacterium]